MNAIDQTLEALTKLYEMWTKDNAGLGFVEDAIAILEAQKAEGDIDAEIGVRPLEPYSAVEDSEAWAALAYWEMNRGNVLERRRALAGAPVQGAVSEEQIKAWTMEFDSHLSDLWHDSFKYFLAQKLKAARG